MRTTGGRCSRREDIGLIPSSTVKPPGPRIVDALDAVIRQAAGDESRRVHILRPRVLAAR